MPKSLKEILDGNDVLAEDLKNELTSAFESRVEERVKEESQKLIKENNEKLKSRIKENREEITAELYEEMEGYLAEQREEVTAELREEFAQRYENDKEQIVEAMDAMLTDAIKGELEEFAEDKAKVVEDRVKYRKSIREHTALLDKFINEVLSKEVRELREDREKQKANIRVLEEFVTEQLTEELSEFHIDKQNLADQKVKMIREGKEVIESAKHDFIKKSSKKFGKFLENVLRDELTTLYKDIQTAKENEFGRRIFETFASEFMTSTLNESSQVSKLAHKINGLKRKITESKHVIDKKDQAILTAKRNARIQKDLSERKVIMSELLGPLGKNQRDVMKTLLESTKTAQLKSAYKKYLPSVLEEKTEVAKPRRTTINENKSRSTPRRSRIVEGNRAEVKHDSADKLQVIEVDNLKRLAGITA